jgi:6-pyruvoyltetrahydropterin/6-carboxytetrahydropterin synthase
MTEKLLHVAAAGFDAARSVGHLPDGHRSGRLHGHAFVGEVRAALPPGWASFPGAETDELTARLQRVVEPLDYRHLNQTLAQPSDENLARWIRDSSICRACSRSACAARSTPAFSWTGQARLYVWRRYVFQSAHQLPRVAPGHKCGRMHGHGFEVLLHATGVDHDGLDALWAPLQAQLHLACLNDIPGLDNPTSENIAAWIWGRLRPALPGLAWVTVYETASCGAQFDGAHYRVWKAFTLDSAVRLRHAPEGDARRRIHGHTFTLRLHLKAPLDQVMGWTVDFGDVKTQFAPLFERLDHEALHELMGADDADTAGIARRIRSMAAPLIPALERIDLNETQGCGVILHWGDAEPTLPV